MPRIIVATDQSPLTEDASVLLDESVQSVHLSSGHAAQQLVERLAWAISDAEAAEAAPPERFRRPTFEETRGRPSRARPGRRPARAPATTGGALTRS